MQAVVWLLSCLLATLLLPGANGEIVVAFAEASEGVDVNEAAGTAIFSVVIVSLPAGDTTVGDSTSGAPLVFNLQTGSVGGTTPATLNIDLTLSDMMVTFDASAQALDIQNITVTGIQDQEAEGTEVLGVTIVDDTGTTYIVNGDGNDFSEVVNINVLDDDTPAFNFVSATFSGDENTILQACVEVTPFSVDGTTEEITIDVLAGDDTAVIGDDYTLTVNPTTLTFPIGSTITDTRCVMITLVSDNTLENSETFTLDLQTPSVGQTGNVNSSVVTINNIDEANVTLDMSAESIEGNSIAVSITLEFGGASLDVAVTVTIATEEYTVGSNPAENDDFTAIDPPPPSTAINLIEFAPGGTSPFVMTVMIDTADDAIGEGDETFFLTITGVTGPATIVNSQATLTILEDDIFTINFHAISTDEITEIQPIIGNFDVCVEVGTPVGSDATELVNAVTVTLGIDGKADENDFTGTLEIEIPASGTLDSFCATFTIVDDDLLEPVEDLIFNIDSFSEKSDLFSIIDPTTHVLMITDNDGTGGANGNADLTFEVDSVDVLEANGEIAQLCVVLGLSAEISALGCDMNVTLGVQPGAITNPGVDYVNPSSEDLNLIFETNSPDGTTRCFNITILDDNIFEGTHSFQLGIMDVTPSGINIDVTTTQVSINIMDNDAEVEFVVDEYFVTEESGSVSVCVESGIMCGFETELTVSLTAQDGTASVSDDVSLPELFEVVFTVGQTTSTSCITINITSDTESEVDESFTISITSTGIEPYAVVWNLSVTTITIFDDDNDDEESGLDMTVLIIGVLIAITVVVAIITFLLGVYSHRVLTLKKTPQPPSPEPHYDDIIVLNPSNGTETTLNRVYDTIIDDNSEDIELSTNEAYNITQHRDTSQRVEN